MLSNQPRALRKRADLTGWVVLYIIGRIYIKRRIQGDMDTDSGDHPGNLPGCHLFFAAYLRRPTRGRRAFCAFRPVWITETDDRKRSY